MAMNYGKNLALFQEVFGSMSGKVLLDMLEEHNSCEFSPDPNEQYYRLGRRDVVREIRNILNLSADDIKQYSDDYDDVDDFI